MRDALAKPQCTVHAPFHVLAGVLNNLFVSASMHSSEAVTPTTGAAVDHVICWRATEQRAEQYVALYALLLDSRTKNDTIFPRVV